jgi:probable HAF family extracellular repeat protein
VGYVVGGVEVPGCFHAALWREAIPVDLGVLGTPPSMSFATSYATDVNNLGDVVGSSMTGAPPPGSISNLHAFLWTDGVMLDLGVLGTRTFQLPDGSFKTLDNSSDRRERSQTRGRLFDCVLGLGRKPRVSVAGRHDDRAQRSAWAADL